MRPKPKNIYFTVLQDEDKQQINPYWLYIFIFALLDWFVFVFWQLDFQLSQ